MTVWTKTLLRTSTVLPTVVLLMGLAVSGAAALWQHRNISVDAETEFQRLSSRTAAEVAARFHKAIYGLNGARGLYAASQSVERAEFRAYVESRDLPKEFPGVRGLGFIQQVMRADLDAFTAKERLDEAPQFTVRQLDDRQHDDLYIIKYIEPQASNAAAMGLDLGSEPVRRAGAQQAVDTGQPTITGSITLVQVNKKTPGVVLYVPVYAKGSHPTNAPERRAALVGLLYAPIVIAELLSGMPDVDTGRLDFEIFDSPVSSPNGTLVFDADNHVATRLAEGLNADDGRRFSFRQALLLPGRELTLSLNSTPLFDASIDRHTPLFMLLGGMIASALLTLLMRQQILGRDRAERLARSMTADLSRLAEVVKHTSNAVSTADETGRITWINEGFTRITGYTLEEAVGKTPAELLGSGKADAQTLKTLSDAASSGQSCRVEILNRAKDGREYWTDTEIQPQFDVQGQHTGFMEIGIDITEHRHSQVRLEAALRDSEALLSALDLHAIISTTDRAGTMVSVNDAFCDISGYDREELIGKNHRIVNSGTHPPAFWVDMWKTITTGMPWHGQLCNRAKDGHLYWVDTFIAPFIGDDGQIDKYISIRIDVTESKRTEEQLHLAKEAAQTASQSKSQFLANMSHEIRTPMNAILGMLTLLRKTALTPKQADYAAKSDGAARALLGLINEILDFSKIEAGKMTLDPHPFSVDQLLRDLSVILATSAGIKPVEVLFDIDPTLPSHLVGDAMRLQQVLLNLGSNAIKFTPEGNVVLSMKVLQQTADAVTLQISMQDSGIGIAPENQARIFSGFTQAESSTTRRFGGTGLGVVISQRFVALMGGELELQSAVGKGSRFYFTITLPLAQEPPEPARPALAPTPNAAPWRALVVDDNTVACEVLEHMGQSLGWTVDVVTSGAQALALLQSNAQLGITYQAIFVDWQMPGMDGWQTSQRIHALPNIGTVPVIVMVTAHGREMLSQRSDAETALLDGFLVKPVTASMLLDAVMDARAGHATPTAAPPPALASPQRLAKMRLLVVEDNLNNQQVARELLEDEGAFVHIANHGQEGVEVIAATNPPFDVVLMDLQMPVMDGFAATRYIRTELGLLRLPIVAMTANAMASDREACLAAGMNDHVGKPFDLSDLVRVLRKSAGWASTEGFTPEASVALSQSATEAAARADIDLRSALNRLGGNQGVYQRMLATFVRDLAAMPDQLQSHAARGETESVQRLLHTLKGLAATLGATALSAQAAKGEKQMAGTPSPADATAVTQEACHAIAAALTGLTDLLQTFQRIQTSDSPPSGSSTPPVDTQALLAALQVMAHRLENSDMDAMLSMAELQQQFGASLAERLESLEEAMADIDFERALPHCNALIESLTA